MDQSMHELIDRCNQAANNKYANQGVFNAGQNAHAPVYWPVDPTAKLVEVIRDHAAAIRELADVIYHVNTED